ncbi:MAG: response regulator transcription factor [Lachnospiraceae bacterium]|nr:response regulator transcription factor [Lachnospiraceae bacterium]
MFHILVIDDDKNTRKLFRAILEGEHYTVSVAENGEEALAMMDSEQFDLAVVDIMMPKIDGYEFTKQLRSVDNTMPILMVTAKVLPEDRKQGYRSGTDDYMTKPVDEEELLLRISALLRRARIANERKIRIGKVTLDYDTFTITRDEDRQTLPQKEFLLLYKLLSYPDKIFTRIQLMDEIWGMDSEAGWETITVHINRLRKRLEHYPEFELVSVRGLGYKAVKHEEQS